MKEELVSFETAKRLKLPSYLPYLSHRWDRMDEYHQLDSNKNEVEVITWFAIIFKKLKIKTFEDVQQVGEYQILSIARTDPVSFYGTFEVDLWGGMFHTCGLYGQSFYNEWIPKKLRDSKGKKSPVYRQRFEFLFNKAKEKFEL